MTTLEHLSKRTERLRRLADDVGARVIYPLANTTTIELRFGDDVRFEFETMRQAEAFLRMMKRAEGPVDIIGGVIAEARPTEKAA